MPEPQAARGLRGAPRLTGGLLARRPPPAPAPAGTLYSLERVRAVIRSDLVAGTRLAIIRHGEAVSNVEAIIAGHLSCTGLTERGRRQVEVLANRLRRTGELSAAAALYSSILPRAVQTAEILAPALGDLPILESCELCERHVGEADGLTWTEYEARYGVLGPDDDPYRPMAPGGESFFGFLERAEVALYEVLARHPARLVVIAGHGGIIGTSMIRFLGIPDHGSQMRAYPDNSSITEWCWTGSRWWLVRFNDAAHLDPESWGAPHGLRIPPPSWVGLDSG